VELSTIATSNPETGAVVLKVVNPSLSREVRAQIVVEGRPSQRFDLWRVHSHDINDRNSLEDPDRIAIFHDTTGPDVEFPAHSVTVLQTRPQ